MPVRSLYDQVINLVSSWFSQEFRVWASKSIPSCTTNRLLTIKSFSSREILGGESKIILAMLLMAQMLIRSQRRIYNLPIQGCYSILPAGS